MTDTPAGRQPPAHRSYLFWRWLPLLLILVGATLFFSLGMQRHLTLTTLRDDLRPLADWIAQHRTLAGIVYVIAYALATAIVPPSGTVMTVIGGFLFGALIGTVLVVIGATSGATLLFLAAKISIGDFLHRKGGAKLRTALQKMESGFRQNELNYMLSLRLMPLFPFWLVNVAPAFLGVRLRNFVIGTFFGIIPGTAAYALFGSGLDNLVAAGEEISVAHVLSPQIIGGLIGLCVLSLLPVIYKRIRTKKTAVRGRGG